MIGVNVNNVIILTILVFNNGAKFMFRGAKGKVQKYVFSSVIISVSPLHRRGRVV